MTRRGIRSDNGFDCVANVASTGFGCISSVVPSSLKEANRYDTSSSPSFQEGVGTCSYHQCQQPQPNFIVDSMLSYVHSVLNIVREGEEINGSATAVFEGDSRGEKTEIGSGSSGVRESFKNSISVSNRRKVCEYNKNLYNNLETVGEWNLLLYMLANHV